MESAEEPFLGYKKMCDLVGPRYAKCWFDNYQLGDDENRPHRQNAIDTARQYAIDLRDKPGSGRNLIMMGMCGTGKDHLAVAVARAALVFRINVKYVRGSVLCNLCNEHKREHASDVPHELLNVELLVISDIEPTPYKASDFEERALLTLIDYRYGKLLPTVVTSNACSIDEMSAVIGERTVSRLFHDAIVVPMMWADFRSNA